MTDSDRPDDVQALLGGFPGIAAGLAAVAPAVVVGLDFVERTEASMAVALVASTAMTLWLVRIIWRWWKQGGVRTAFAHGALAGLGGAAGFLLIMARCGAL